MCAKWRPLKTEVLASAQAMCVRLFHIIVSDASFYCALGKREQVATEMKKFLLPAAVCLIVVGCLRIASTYSALNQTYDEPAHIACGMEFLDKGVYLYEAQHPPLTRLAVALGPYLAGGTSHSSESMWDEGNAILYSGDYYKNLALARAGNLPFFILAAIGTFVCAWILYSPAVGLASLFIFTMMPTVLAHAGLATTDMGIAAFAAPASIAFLYWLKAPTFRRSCLLALLVSLCFFSKFSAILFLGVSFTAGFLLMAFQNRHEPEGVISVRMFKMGGLVVALFLLTGWSYYGFSLQSILIFPKDMGYIDALQGKLPISREMLIQLGQAGVPLSEVVRGIGTMLKHNYYGHLSYLLGSTSETGWWYYFLVVLAVKVPLAILALAVAGTFFIFKKAGSRENAFGIYPVVFVAAILVVCMFGAKVNLGVRHILPLFPFLAMISGYGLICLFQVSRLGKMLSLFLIITIVTASASAHPDYLSYFNLVAKDRPYDYLLDSNLDWGQHLDILSDRLEEMQVDELSIAYFGTANEAMHNMPPSKDLTREMPQEVSGWVAVSAYYLYTNPQFAWLRSHTPQENVRNTIFLYHFPEPVPTTVSLAN